MQNAGLQYGEGVTPVQESPFGATSVQSNTSSSTSSLRQFRKKENVDKSSGTIGGLSAANTGADTATSSHVARVAPHNHYPHKQNEYYRYPPQFQEYSSPYKEHTVKYSEIAEPVIQSIPHLDHLPQSVLTKHKEKDFVEMCNIPQQTHINKTYSEHQFNPQQGYSAEMALHQYMHKEPQGPQMHASYKPESQYIPKEGAFNHQIPPFLKYNIPQSRNYGRIDNSSLASFQRMDPHIARSLMTEHHHMRDFSSEYGPMEQGRMYSQKQRYYAPPLPPTNSTYASNYSPRNLPAQQYNYPSCNYPRTAQMNSSMGRYQINMERSVSPRRTYADNIDMGMNFAPVPQKITAGYPNYPAYAQHYQQRRPTAVPQEYYHPQQHPHARPHPQYMPAHHPQEVAENHVASNNIRQYLENWAEEEGTAEIPTQIENSKYLSRINRDDGNEVFVINASELPQYLESGVPLVTSENGQYIFKSNVSIDNTGAIKILEKTVENAVLPTDAQERVVSLHIIENPKADCLVNNRPSEQPNQAPAATINVIATSTNHPNVENNHTFNIPQATFNANRMNLVHQVSPVVQNYDSSINLSLHPNAGTSLPQQLPRPGSGALEPNLQSSLEKPPEQSVKILPNANAQDNRLKIEVLSYNEVPQSSCIVVPSTQSRLNFDESLLPPNTVPSDSKMTKNEFVARNDPASEHILSNGHEELDKIVEDTLTSTHMSLPLGSQLTKIEEKCDSVDHTDEGVNSRIPDDLNLDLESNPKDLTGLSVYSVEENSINQSEDIMDLRTSSRRQSNSDEAEQIIPCAPADLSVSNTVPEQTNVASDAPDLEPIGENLSANLNNESTERNEESVSSPIKHMPLIFDNLDHNPKPTDNESETSKEVPKVIETKETEASTDDDNNSEVKNIEPDNSSSIAELPETDPEITKPSLEEQNMETTTDLSTQNTETNIVIAEKQDELVEESRIPEDEQIEAEKQEDGSTNHQIIKEEDSNLKYISNQSTEEDKNNLSMEVSDVKNIEANEEVPRVEVADAEKMEVDLENVVVSSDMTGNADIPPEITEEESNETPIIDAENKTETPPQIDEERVEEVHERTETIPIDNGTEQSKEGIRKKRIFSVDDIIYRIGSNPSHNHSKSSDPSLDQERESEDPLEETKLDSEVLENAKNKSLDEKVEDDEDSLTKTEEMKVQRNNTENKLDNEDKPILVTNFEDSKSIPELIEDIGNSECDLTLTKEKSVIPEELSEENEQQVENMDVSEITSVEEKFSDEIEVCPEAMETIECEEIVNDISPTYLVTCGDIMSVDRTSEFVSFVSFQKHISKDSNSEGQVIECVEVNVAVANDIEIISTDDATNTLEKIEEKIKIEETIKNNQDSLEEKDIQKSSPEDIIPKEDYCLNANSCRFTVIKKTEDTAKEFLKEIENNNNNAVVEEQEVFRSVSNNFPETPEAEPNEEQLETFENYIEDVEVEQEISEKPCDKLSEELSMEDINHHHRSVIHSTENELRCVKSPTPVDQKARIETGMKISKETKDTIEIISAKKPEATFEERFVEPFLVSKSESTPKKDEDVEEKISTDDVEYRNVLKIEENSVLLEIGGELVEICVNLVNGKKVITVLPLSNTTTVDINDNYEGVDRAQVCEDAGGSEENETSLSDVQEESCVEKDVPLLNKPIDEHIVNRNEEITSTQIDSLANLPGSEEIFEDVILNENEIIIGDESLEEEIDLDLKSDETSTDDSVKNKPILYTKAAKKLYDDHPLKTPSKSYNSLREFRRIKIKPESSAVNEKVKDRYVDSKDKKYSKRSIRVSTRHTVVSEQKEESQIALRELIKRRKMRKEKIRLKYCQYAKSEPTVNQNSEPVDLGDCSNRLNSEIDLPRMNKACNPTKSKYKSSSTSSASKKIKACNQFTSGAVTNIDGDLTTGNKKKKIVEQNAETKEPESSVEMKEVGVSSNTDSERKKTDENLSTLISVCVTTTLSPPKNFPEVRSATSQEIPKKSNNLQNRDSKFPKISPPRDLTLMKNVNEHYLSRKDHSNLKKKLSIQEYNSRKRKSDSTKASDTEKCRKMSVKEDGWKKKVPCEESLAGVPSTIYQEKQYEYAPHGLKDPRRRPLESTHRPQVEELTSWQTPNISSSKSQRVPETSQSVSFKDSLLNSKHSYSRQMEDYKNYKTSMLEKASVEKCVPRSMKISNRRRTIEVMNERKYEPKENRKSISVEDNVQIHEIHTTEMRVAKVKPETSSYCEVTSSSCDVMEEISSDAAYGGDDKPSNFKLSRLSIRKKLENDWEDSNSPKDCITDAFAENFLENNKLESLKHKNKGKLIIDINDFDTSLIDNELKSPLRVCFNNNLTQGDDGCLKNYKEEVDSKLNSLNIHIPKTTKTKVLSEDDILMHKFLRKEQLNSEEIKQIRRIIYLKKKIQQIAQQNLAVGSKNVNEENYDVKDNTEILTSDDMKEELRKVDGKLKKKRKRFRNLYSDSPETSEGEVQQTAGEFSVYEGKNLSGVKLIFKRKTDLLHLQPVVKLQRCNHIESMAKKLKLE